MAFLSSDLHICIYTVYTPTIARGRHNYTRPAKIEEIGPCLDRTDHGLSQLPCVGCHTNPVKEQLKIIESGPYTMSN